VTTPARDQARFRKSKEKGDLILDAACQVFLNQGYAGASMDAIAQQAGVAKQTIYHHFSSKERLFAATIHERCEGVLAALDPASEKAALEPAAEIAATLRALAEGLHAKITQPTSRALFRLVIAAADEFPAVAREAYDIGIALTVARLADYLGRRNQQGLLRIEDPRRAAWQFLSLVVHPVHLWTQFGMEAELDKTARAEIIAEAVKTFLARYGPTDGKS
jgi:TetR/AcrR family transcriptional repressor of mexJK operon